MQTQSTLDVRATGRSQTTQRPDTPLDLEAYVAPVTSPSLNPSLNSQSPAASAQQPPWLWMTLTVLTSVILSGGVQVWAARTEPPPIVLHAPPTPAPTITPLPTATPSPIKVFVSGAVAQPGVYEVPAVARVADALTQAGGLLTDADAVRVNQAEHLWDGAQVHVPFLPQDAGVGDAPGVGGPTAAEPAPGVSGSMLLVNPVPGAVNLPGSAGGAININTATLAELVTLPGIGESRASDIIAGRPYQSVDELEKVSGIGAKTLEKLRDLVTVQ